MTELDRLKELANINEAEDNWFIDNIEALTEDNTFYRKVIFTDTNIQLVLMSVAAGEEIGEEVHKGDQFIRIETGDCKFVLNGKTFTGSDGFATVIPKGTKHNVINVGDVPLQLYAIYSPPEHEPGEEQENKPK